MIQGCQGRGKSLIALRQLLQTGNKVSALLSLMPHADRKVAPLARQLSWSCRVLNLAKVTPVVAQTHPTARAVIPNALAVTPQSSRHPRAGGDPLRKAKDCHMKQPAVYLLSSKPNGTLYIGVTSDLVQRIWQHREGVVEGFTRQYGIKTLVWYEQHETMQSAIGREKALKKWNRAWKLRLVEECNPQWLDLWPEITDQESHEVLNKPSRPSASASPSFPSAFIGNPAVSLDSRLRGNDDGEGDEQ